ncbi:MAG: 2-hydroxyglutaryl-CoA dehydratase subunit [Actinobacteria bacterium]|nr:MAG: 2-hydroxyglutaryl-CoA dehydratase subunit [Actinomycetota bacterium]
MRRGHVGRTIGEILAEVDQRLEWAQIRFKEAKESGLKVIGLYCGYIPFELVRAVGAIPVSLCGSDADAIPSAELELPRNFCPLIKSSYGLAITDTCPFFHFADALIGETTCDGKKKVFELLARLRPVHVMQLPYDKNAPGALDQWRSEMKRVSEFLVGVTGIEPTPERLSAEIYYENELRRVLQRIVRTFERPVPSLTWTQMLSVRSLTDFVVDRAPYLALIEELAEAVSVADAAVGDASTSGRMPRVLVTGSPMSPETNKVMRIAEESGALVVAHDACSGTKMFDRLVDEEGDPLDALTRYTLYIPCACMSPNDGRVDLLRSSVSTYGVEGVIDTVWQACHTFNVESVIVQRACREELNVPCLKIETDYSAADEGQLRTRIEAFVEQML